MPTDMVLKLFISLLGASKVLNCTYRSENQFSQGACPWTPLNTSDFNAHVRGWGCGW